MAIVNEELGKMVQQYEIYTALADAVWVDIQEAVQRSHYPDGSNNWFILREKVDSLVGRIVENVSYEIVRDLNLEGKRTSI